MPSKHALDTSLHERRRAERMRDPEYREAYERSAREIEQTDEVIRALDALRVDLGMSKAELARRIDRNASSIRRLFTASRARPELPLVAAIAWCRRRGRRSARPPIVRAGGASRSPRRRGRGQEVRSSAWLGGARRPVAPAIRGRRGSTGARRGRSSTTRPGTGLCRGSNSSTPARARSMPSSRRSSMQSPERHRRSSRAVGSGRRCTARWLAGTRSA